MAEILSMEPEKNIFEKFVITIKRATNSRTFGVVALLAIIAAVPVTVYLSQQKQDVRNRAQEEHPQNQAKSVPDEILLKFKAGVREEAKNTIRKQFGLEKQGELKQLGIEQIKVPEHIRDQIIEALSHNPRVEFAEPNFLLEEQAVPAPNDHYYTTGPQWGLEKIGMLDAWEITKGEGAVVAVIDSGIQKDHPDFQGKLWVNTGEIAGNGIDDDNNEKIDDVNGWNFVDGNGDVTDVTSHGTAVSGVIGALTNNSIGVASVGWHTKIMPLRFITTEGTGSSFAMASAMIYAADHGAKAINISTANSGSNGVCSSMQLYGINYAWSRGVVIAAAAGNQGGNSIGFPAACDHVLAVGSTTADDAQAAGSNTGLGLDVMAPGQNVYTTDWQGGYSSANGTSFATPHVAALAALIMSAKPGINNQEVVDAITSTAVDLGDFGWDNYFGFGRINALKALQKALGLEVSSDNQPPVAQITSPTNGTTVSGLVDIKVDASDNVSVTKVELYRQGTGETNHLVATLTMPYIYSWDTTQETNGYQFSYTAKAFDLANNSSLPSTITVNVKNALVPSPTLTPTPIPLTPTRTSTSTIQSLSITSISSTTTANSASIKWFTNVPATSQVLYGTSRTNLNLATPLDSAFLLPHTASISNLTKSTSYYYQIVAKDAQGKEVKSAIGRFQTKNK
jgi:thermitase